MNNATKLPDIEIPLAGAVVKVVVYPVNKMGDSDAWMIIGEFFYERSGERYKDINGSYLPNFQKMVHISRTMRAAQSYSSLPPETMAIESAYQKMRDDIIDYCYKYYNNGLYSQEYGSAPAGNQGLRNILEDILDE